MTMPFFPGIALLASMWFVTAAAGAQPGRARDVDAVVARAAAHVRAFVEAASVIIADEHYVQELKARTGLTTVPADGSFGLTVEKRTLDSEVALVQLADRQLWMVARDVLTVDGKPVAARDRVPLATYRSRSMDEALGHFRDLATQSARFNIGTVTRNVNVPSLALWFLTDGVRERFRFSLGRTEKVDGQPAIVLNYRERSSPYLLNTDGRGVPVNGRFWVAPDSGAVLRTELTLYAGDASGGRVTEFMGDNDTATARAVVVVQFRHDATVDAWAPSVMTERYDYPKVMNAGVIIGRAEYGNLRKFSATSRIVQ